MEPLIGQKELNEWLKEQRKRAQMAPEERNSAMKVEDLRSGKFYWIRKNVLQKIGPVTGVYGVAVYNVLAYFANGYSRKTFPSITTICKILSCGRKQVIETIEKLESLKVIKVIRKPGRVNVYQLIDID